MPDTYRRLIVWGKGMELAAEVYRVSAGFPVAERFALTDQVRRAAVSVPANIAEGCGRGSKADHARFLSIAKGSLYEMETLLLLAERLGYVERDGLKGAFGLADEVGRMLTALRRSLTRATSAS